MKNKKVLTIQPDKGQIDKMQLLPIKKSLYDIDEYIIRHGCLNI
jgi:hypothetical protein